MSKSDMRPRMSDDAITRHFFNGFIRLHILYHAAKEPVYGAEITEELVRHGYRISQGTLYPTLHLLEKLGYLRSHEQVVQRPAAQILPGHRGRAAKSWTRPARSSWNWSPRSSRTTTSRFRPSAKNDERAPRRSAA